MARTKGDLVLKALRKCGLYSDATLTDADPQSIADSVQDLEDMMSAWLIDGKDLGYLFADEANDVQPLPGDDSGLPAWAYDGVSLKLALKICLDNVVQPSVSLLSEAKDAYEIICTALTTVPPLERRNDMPVGQGNRTAFVWGRFYIEKNTPNT